MNLSVRLCVDVTINEKMEINLKLIFENTSVYVYNYVCVYDLCVQMQICMCLHVPVYIECVYVYVCRSTTMCIRACM